MCETNKEQTARLKKLFVDIFAHDHSTYISLSSHSGAIAAALRAIGHQPFHMVTGSVLPMLVKAETVEQGILHAKAVSSSTTS